MKAAKLLQTRIARDHSDKKYVKHRKVKTTRPLECIEMDIKMVWIPQKGKNAYLLSVIDVHTRRILKDYFSFNIKQKQVIELLSELFDELDCPKNVVIRSDNGKEFANHKEIAQALDIDYYFAKPYHSWERGANENLNGLVRQYFPKKTNFENINKQEIEKVIKILNNRPRKRFGYKNPNEILAQKLDEMSEVAFNT